MEQMHRHGIFVHPGLPYVSNSETSYQAARSVHKTATTASERVAQYIREQGAHGATDQEIQRALSMGESTERPRRVELVQDSRIADSGRTRLTASGKSAAVWVCR